MAVIKANVQSEFVVVSNKVAQDSRLSLEARGMVLLMGSRPAGWKFNKAELMQNAGVGRDKLNRIFSELINFGHLAVVQNHDASGRFVDADYHFFTESSQNPAFIEIEPRTEKPYTENPCNGKSAPINKESFKNKDSIQNEQELLDEGFELFWEQWHNKKDRAKAKEKFNKLAKKELKKSEQDFRSFVEMITIHAVERIEFIKMMKQADRYYSDGFEKLHATTYLNNARWEDEYRDQ